MKFFTKYSFFANTVSIVVVVVSILYISYKALEGGVSPNQEHKDKARVELTAYNFHYNEYDKDGDLKTNFVSGKLEQYTNQDVKMTDLIERSYDKKTGKKTWQVKSKHGFSSKETNENLIHLYDGVDAIMFLKKKANSENEQASSDDSNKYSPDKLYIKTSEMYYNTDSKDFYNNNFVKMYDPKTGNNTTGVGVRGNADSKVINLNQDVRSYYASS
ncbi:MULTISPECIES: LPS export ABC transporter periplasmic protein LptC [unclassified Francisella]|uniref:LPS export ABC transporter periplasmic protein LptC n=1 Tax=unclassified Francisella TaxID=2610885 RepID=UPI002E34D8C4|nr:MULTISPECIES: LPS export ABC transporter periplasmic protein LptC [unclassified Francisella]MED7819575.1 LPS export ABC transporter periplasmic protein LptC [Francisella sp. 19S2-4]MED7830407.1 LPS export ABC transporter periplasmic protein LptC [Francisella sp. 19S2-10]